MFNSLNNKFTDNKATGIILTNQSLFSNRISIGYHDVKNMAMGSQQAILLTRKGWLTKLCQYTRPLLVQKIACHLFGAKPLSEPNLTYYQLDPWEHTSLKFLSKQNNFHSRKFILLSAKWHPFRLGCNILTNDFDLTDTNMQYEFKNLTHWPLGDVVSK